MAEINGMPHASANAIRYQGLRAVTTQGFGQSAKLRQAEVIVRQFIENKTGGE
jgi:hypothetical protein